MRLKKGPVKNTRTHLHLIEDIVKDVKDCQNPIQDVWARIFSRMANDLAEFTASSPSSSWNMLQTNSK